MSLLEGTDGRCVMCGAWPGEEHDDIAHHVAKQQGWIAHGTFERSHLQGHECPEGLCRKDPAEKRLEEKLVPPQQQLEMAQLMAQAMQQKALVLRPFRHVTDEDQAFVTWLLVAPTGPTQMLLVGQLFDQDGGRGWIPLDEYGRPAGMATGQMEPVGAKPPGPPPS